MKLKEQKQEPEQEPEQELEQEPEQQDQVNLKEMLWAAVSLISINNIL